MGSAQATRRMGRWERNPEFRTCLKEAARDQPDYVDSYVSCLKLEIVDDEAMKCVQEITPAKDLSGVEMCQRQLGDVIAYGDGRKVEGRPPGAGIPLGILATVF